MCSFYLWCPKKVASQILQFNLFFDISQETFVLSKFNSTRQILIKKQIEIKLITKTRYSKSQIFVQKFNFDKTPTFSRVFHPNFFWQFFSWNQSCQQLKCPKPQLFHEFFTQKIDNFLGKTKLNFWTKNEDFEQCDLGKVAGRDTFLLNPFICEFFHITKKWVEWIHSWVNTFMSKSLQMWIPSWVNPFNSESFQYWIPSDVNPFRCESLHE